ncbi:YopT tranlocation T [Chlamydia abortus]|jgi:flagellar biosynthetic protein FliR|uniref:Flagellar biosynthetic protein FliR n=1 Tax=Paenibacillus residui TaxID=629724 RepID=A0ABW3D789_9BACL|nr:MULTISPECIES: flagellar biosynthetic protein FliR [Paenibacillaceae]SHE12137.1 YopT tranlocation T [Chlamydia abortus]
MEFFLQFIPNVLLIFCRITSFFLASPVFTARNVPPQFKLGLSFFLTLMAIPAIGDEPIPMDGEYFLSIIREILIGLLLGLIANFIFTAVQIAGAFIDVQIGFAMANVMDPMTGVQTPLLGNFKYFIALLLFLTFNGHHLLIQAIVDSYEWVPLSNDFFAHIARGHVSEFLVQAFITAFALAFQMAAPLVASLFLVDVGLGVLAKTAPQFNIFVLGIPMKILVGLILLFFFIPGMYNLFSDLFKTMFEHMQRMLEILAVPGSS